MPDTKPQIREYQITPGTNSQTGEQIGKQTSDNKSCGTRLVVVKLLETKEGEKTLKAAREENDTVRTEKPE